jgi:hypothetical protein
VIIMGEAMKRATVYFRPELHKALRLKAAATERSISDLINEAVRDSLREDEADLAVFEERAAEASISYEALQKDLKRKEGKPMAGSFKAIIKQDGPWWIGWIEEVPGVNCQERSRKELLESLRQTLAEALEMNRKEALDAAGANFQEEQIGL